MNVEPFFLGVIASENRKRVYFPTTGEGGPELEDDEFFGCAELLAK